VSAMASPLRSLVPQSLRSSYGPLGTSKLISNKALGQLLVTRDGEQIVEAIEKSGNVILLVIFHAAYTHRISDALFVEAADNLMEKTKDFHLKQILRHICKGHSDRYGDGYTTIAIILSTLIEETNSIISPPVSLYGYSSSLSSTCHNYKRRIRLHLAVKEMLYLLNTEGKMIFRMMRDQFIWCDTSNMLMTVINSFKEWACCLWRTVIAPSLNSTAAIQLVPTLVVLYSLSYMIIILTTSIN
jgi:hypothetical protein